MRYLTFTILFVLGVGLQAQTYRYTQSIFDVSITENVVYTNAATYGIDPNRIYMAGSSAGAFICLHSVYMNDSDEKPAHAGSYTYNNPIIPFNQITAPDLGGYDKGSNLEQDGDPDAIFCLWGALQSTELIEAKDNIPIYLVHGTSDSTVPFGVGSPFGLPSFSSTYGSSPISTAIEGQGYDGINTWFVAGEGHEFYGVSNGDWASSPNDYWDTTVEKATGFFHEQHKPQAGFSFSSRALDIVFTNESSDDKNWYWDFGDGESSRLENPDHSYAASGTYTVTLHVENKIKSWDEYSTDVSVDNTGIEKIELNQIGIYPNPVKDILMINDLPVGLYILNFVSRQKHLQHRIIKTLL